MCEEIKGYKLGEGKPLICVPIVERQREAVIREARILADKKTAVIEWRVDHFSDAMSEEAVLGVVKELAALMTHSVFLFTFRTKRQGGELTADKEYLERLYEAAAKGGADLIDIEYFENENSDSVIRRLKKCGAKVIASHHNFMETPPPEDMRTRLEKMREGGADIVKLAVMPKNPSDVLQLLSVTNEIKEKYPSLPIVTMSMGKYGVVSRIAGEVFGSCITFGSHERPSAPGQMQMDKLNTVLDYLHEAM